MKKLLFFSVALFWALGSHATSAEYPRQPEALLLILTDSIPMDSTKKSRSIKIAINRDDGDSTKTRRIVRTRWAMLDYGISTYLHQGKMDLPLEYAAMEQTLLGSSNWNFHLVQQRVNLHKRKVNLLYGLTFEFNKYRFVNDQTLLPEQQTVTFQENPDVDFKRNQLNTSYMTVPLMVNFKVKPKRGRQSFNLSAGGYGGFLLNARTKQHSEEFGKVKTKDDFNLNKARYGLSARAGYGPFNIYANYALSGLFDKDETGDYDLHPFNVGISIIPF
jgi:hypothetical protein